MTYLEAGPHIASALSTLIIWGFSRSHARVTQETVQTESSKIQYSVSESAKGVKTDVIEAITSRPVAASVEYGDRLSALERKLDLIAENLRRKPGTPWVDEITKVSVLKE